MPRQLGSPLRACPGGSNDSFTPHSLPAESHCGRTLVASDRGKPDLDKRLSTHHGQKRDLHRCLLFEQTQALFDLGKRGRLEQGSIERKHNSYRTLTSSKNNDVSQKNRWSARERGPFSLYLPGKVGHLRSQACSG